MDLKQKKTVYFVRHGQSTHNARPVFQGADSRLSELGCRQAEAVASRLAGVPFEALISSPLPRARQTAEAIAAKTGHEIVMSDLFVERAKPSALAGRPYAEESARQLYDDYIQTMYQPGRRVSDAENYDDITKRADKALDYLLTRPEATLAVVTHGWFLRVIIARVLLDSRLTGALLKRFEKRISAGNAAITILTYQDAYAEDFAWRLRTLNDCAHCAEQPRATTQKPKENSTPEAGHA